MTAVEHPSITVRPVTTDDIEFMVHLFLQVRYQLSPLGDGIDVDAVVNGTRAATREQAQGKIPQSVTNVIMADGQRVGRLRLVRPGSEIEVAGLQILPSYQRQGVGEAVLTQVIDEATAQGLPVVIAVDKDNPSPEALYTRLGFERYGEIAAAFKLRRMTA
ncbi:MAG: GNAT family N-acetyltransferase [Thermomicrobiales bacterium]